MTKFIWMSDPHYQNSGAIAGLDPRQRLDAAIRYANANYPDALGIIISGDLVGDDIAGDYAQLAQSFSDSALPVFPMVGNNDDREEFLRTLNLPKTTMRSFAQYEVATPDGLILCLDTHDPGKHSGAFCAERMAWLDERLHRAADRPVYIFMHHPPMALHLPPQDSIALEAGDAFLTALAKRECVRHLFMGHVHRATSGVIRRIPFSTLGSLAFQAPAPRPAWNWDSFLAPQEAPQLAVVHLNAGDVVIQYTQFCRYDLGISPH